MIDKIRKSSECTHEAAEKSSAYDRNRKDRKQRNQRHPCRINGKCPVSKKDENINKTKVGHNIQRRKSDEKKDTTECTNAGNNMLPHPDTYTRSFCPIRDASVCICFHVYFPPHFYSTRKSRQYKRKSG